MRLRVARHTDDLAAVVEFYRDRVGLPELGRFSDHDGYDGVFLDVPGTGAHLEFTTGGPHAAAAAHPEELLVLYLRDDDAVARIAERIGRPPVTPANPYWRRHATTFADPDGRHLVLVGSGDRPVEPDAVAQLDAVEHDGVVAGRRGERVALDVPHPEPEALVEAQIARVGGRRRHHEHGASLVRGEPNGSLEEPAADPAALVRRRHGHVLDLEPRGRGLRELQVADDATAFARDEHAAVVDVGVQLPRGVLRQLEQRSDVLPRAVVALDLDHGVVS
jgi:hypothetical protein